jgi:hypothetical protein
MTSSEGIVQVRRQLFKQNLEKDGSEMEDWSVGEMGEWREGRME